jgi:hypothetical protein
MPYPKLVKGICIQIGQIGDDEVGVYDVADDPVADHSGVGVLVCALDVITEFIRHEHVLDEGVEQQVGMFSFDGRPCPPSGGWNATCPPSEAASPGTANEPGLFFPPMEGPMLLMLLALAALVAVFAIEVTWLARC